MAVNQRRFVTSRCRALPAGIAELSRSCPRRIQPADLTGVDAHGVARFAYRQRDHGIALQAGEACGFTSIAVDRLQKRLRAARQVDL